MLPELVDIVTIKSWKPKVNKETNCFLYDIDSLGIKLKDISDLIAGRQAMLFEKPLKDKFSSRICPWCEYKQRDSKVKPGSKLVDHIFTHPRKNLVSFQLVKFSKEMHTLKLQLVRKGYHEALSFFVEHSCQDCAYPIVQGREGLCALEASARPRMRSLKILNYPVKHLISNPKRKYRWSMLGLIVLMKTETTQDLPIL